METGSVPPCFLRDALSNVSGVTIRRHRSLKRNAGGPGEMYRVRSLCGGMSKRCHPHGRRTAHTGCRGLRILRQMYQILSDGCKRSDRTGIYGKRTGKELMKDQMFYEESGGGVTLSGGEVMSMDMDYLLAVAKELKRQDVTLTIDTCGFVPYESSRNFCLM